MEISAIDLIVKLPLAEAVAEIVAAVAEKVKDNKELSATDKLVLTAAVSGVVK